MRISDQTLKQPAEEFSAVKPVQLTKPDKTGRLSKLQLALGAVVLVVVIIVGLVALGVLDLGQTPFLGGNSQSAEDAEAERILGLVSDNNMQQILDLQSAEPIVATIVDPELMRSEDAEFYADAETGDKVIILNQLRLIILYRENSDSIVNIAGGSLAVTNP